MATAVPSFTLYVFSPWTIRVQRVNQTLGVGTVPV